MFREKVLLAAQNTVLEAEADRDGTVDRVTEGRWKESNEYPDGTRHPYGWCGDFVHYVLATVLCDVRYSNRNACYGWKVTENILRLIKWAKATNAFKAPTSTPLPGDIVLYDRAWGGHVDVLEQFTSMADFSVITGNAGPGTMEDRGTVARRHRLGEKRVKAWLDTELMLAHAETGVVPGQPSPVKVPLPAVLDLPGWITSIAVDPGQLPLIFGVPVYSQNASQLSPSLQQAGFTNGWPVLVTGATSTGKPTMQQAADMAIDIIGRYMAYNGNGGGKETDT